MSWKTDLFGDEILTKEGRRSTVEALDRKKYIGIYFSAHWCPPCRGFTPVLAEFYESVKSERNDAELEIVFVSSDSDQESFEEYWGSMPWKALPHGSEKKVEPISSIQLTQARFEILLVFFLRKALHTNMASAAYRR